MNKKDIEKTVDIIKSNTKEVTQDGEYSAKRILRGRVFLDVLDMSACNQGYYFLLSALDLIDENPSLLHNITRGIYGNLAEMFNTKSPTVERCMRHCIISIQYPNIISKEPINVSEFIARVYEKEKLGYFEDILTGMKTYN